MKKFLLSTVALATLTASAVAADLPARRMAPAPFAAVPVFTWTGFYVGANIGVGWNDRNRNNTFGFFDNGLVAPAPGGGVVGIVPVGGTFGTGLGFIDNNRDRTSILGGVQIGYNVQMGGFVVGVEGDIQAIGNRNRNDFGFGLNNGFGTAVPTAAAVGAGVVAPVAGAPGNVAFFNNGGVFGGNDGRRGDWFATARVRLGFAMDRALLYVTGGAAFMDDRNRNNGFGFAGGFGSGAAVPAPFFVTAGAAAAGAGVGGGGVGFFGDNGSRNNVGWALGAGVEYAFTNNLSAKLEYLHIDFDRGNRNGGFFGNQVVGVTNTGAPVTATNVGFGNNRRGGNDIDIVRVGLNYRFGL